MLTDIQIAQQAKLRPIAEIAEQLNLAPEEVELYGPYKAGSTKVYNRLKTVPMANSSTLPPLLLHLPERQDCDHHRRPRPSASLARTLLPAFANRLSGLPSG